MRLLGSLWLGLALVSCAPADAPPPLSDDEIAPATATAAGSLQDAREGGDPAASEPAEELPVVVFFGTSLTAGLGLPSEDDTYAAHAAELAAEAGVPFRAVNAGVSGETSAAGARRIDWVLRNPLDVLVIELGANDGLRGLDLDALRANLRLVVEHTRERYPEAPIVLLGMEAPPNLGERYTTAFRDVFVEVADVEGTWFVPFLLEGVAGVPELNQSDGIHPTIEGHRRMAEHILPTLQAALNAVYERRGAVEPSGTPGTGGNR
jgi:acyl-CoA thioesterase-1